MRDNVRPIGEEMKDKKYKYIHVIHTKQVMTNLGH